MSDSPWKNRDDELVHPNAPQGSGGHGTFQSANPLGTGLDLSSSLPHPFSPDGHNQSYEVVQLDEGASLAEDVLTFTDTSTVPHSVTADTVQEFVNKSNAAMGDGGTVGHMQPTINFDMNEFDGKGRVTKVKMVVNTEIVRPRHSLGRTNENEKKLIDKAVELIKKHEERHRDICKEYMEKAFKAMHGKTAKEAEAALKEWEKKMDKAQEEFDAKEGQLHVDFNGPNGTAGPATDVRTGPITKKK